MTTHLTAGSQLFAIDQITEPALAGLSFSNLEQIHTASLMQA